jgi:hypothetical protein
MRQLRVRQLFRVLDRRTTPAASFVEGPGLREAFGVRRIPPLWRGRRKVIATPKARAYRALHTLARNLKGRSLTLIVVSADPLRLTALPWHCHSCRPQRLARPEAAVTA